MRLLDLVGSLGRGRSGEDESRRDGGQAEGADDRRSAHYFLPPSMKEKLYLHETWIR